MALRKPVSTYILLMLVLLVLVNVIVVVLNVGLIFNNQHHELVHLQLQPSPRKAVLRLSQYPHELLQLENEVFGPQMQPGLDISRGDIKEPSSYTISHFVFKGDDWHNLTLSWPVCLSTQASVNLLFWVGEQVKTWTGPVSVTIFVPDSDYTVAIMMVELMRSCHVDIRNRVSFHMAYPTEFPPRAVQVKTSRISSYNCNQLEALNKDLVLEMNGTLQSRRIRDEILYPQNLLRNVARESCNSDYAFTPDIDMVSVGGMSDQLRSFLNRQDVRQCEKCAFIIPTYEIHAGAPRNPSNKEELIRYINGKWARRFHSKTFKPNQANSQLGLWEQLGTTRKRKGPSKHSLRVEDSLMTEVNGSLKVVYDVLTWKNLWEPVYVAEASVPPFDERFVGYGCTRSSQVYEMHVAGYRWRMLNDAFLCHRGFQDKRSKLLWPQMNNNFKLYQDFMKEVQQLYGVWLPNLEQTHH